MPISTNTAAGATFTPTEVLYDPTNKFRTASPQSLIDTDFEYGTQSSKWESVGLINNRPFSFPNPTALSNIATITQNANSRTVTVALNTVTATPNAIAAATFNSVGLTGFFEVTTAAAHGFSAGQYVTLSGVTTTLGYNDTWLIHTVTSTTKFVVQSTLTGTATFSSASAIAGVAPKNFTPLTISDTFLIIANGNFLVETGGGTGTFTYTARAANTTALTALFDSNKTNIFVGTLYSGASIGATGTATFAVSTNKVTVTTAIAHGLSIGNEVAITGITGTNPPNGSQLVAQITSPTVFAYYVVGSAPSSLTTSNANVYTRPQAQFLHRPFDGGVMFSANALSNNEQAIRQTRRYFRYQSGKGIQMSSGTVLKPSFQIEALTSAGTTATVQTKEKHNLQPGATITISGANEANYNTTTTVTSVTGFNTFTYTMAGSATSPASGNHYTVIANWNGAINRLGIFDSQNGLFWEFDGTTLWAVRRSSVYQIAGRVSATLGSTTITQTGATFPTTFAKQLTPGDFIVIRGQSYRVTDIASDTSMTITPAYRGATATNVIVSKTIDTKINQTSFNIDKLNGSGSSGYNIDLTKMQMFYIDYTWYGAGFVRWGVRGPNGDVMYAHKLANNNVNNESYMRSGNLPGRYETNTIPPYTYLTAGVLVGDVSLTVADTSLFPSTGTLVVRNAASGYEFVNYTGKTSTTFTGLTRAQAGQATLALTIAVGSNTATVGSNSGLQIGQRVIDTTSGGIPEGTFITNIVGTTLTLSQAATAANPTVVVPPMGAGAATAFTYSTTAPTAVELAYPSFSPSIAHWGTSVIMDGRFDDDKSLLFTYGQTTFTTIAAGDAKALLSIRVSPSVDNGVPAAFGSRELINRMQLVLRTLDVTSKTGGNLLITAILNGTPSTATQWTNAVRGSAATQNSSLAQIADYAGGSTKIYGGETTGGFFLAAVAASIELDKVRDLGNNILGGGTTTADSGVYPDGPDVLTIYAQNVGTGSMDLLARLSWSEAQA
jgi:hypothetical protein